MPSILVVDDDAVIAMMFEDWLAELGHEILGPAYNVASALALIDKSPPQAAILDVSLGRETAFPVADALASRNIPFTFSTGYGVAALPPRFSGSPILVKPFEYNDLRSAIKNMIAGSAS